MNTTIVVGILSLCGTLIGTLGGILTSNKLTNYKIDELSKRVDKHNSLVERMYDAEEEIAILKEKIDGRKRSNK